MSALLLGLLAAGCGREQGSLAPSLVAISPSRGAAGATLDVTLSGANFSNGATVNVGSAQIGVSNVAVLSGGQITARLALGSGAAVGPISISVTSAGQTTNAVAFNIAPEFTVTQTAPANGAAGIPINQSVSATFGMTPQCSTLTAASFTLAASGVPVAGAVACSGSTAVFTPLGSLASNTVYTATISTAAADTGGDSLTAPYVWSFTTQPAPAVISTSPAAGATGLALTPTALSANFNQTINCATLSAASFTVATPAGAPIAGTVTCSGSMASFTPSANLAANTVYTLALSTAVQSPSGASMASPYAWSLKTGTGTLLTPTVIATVPANGSTGVAVNQQITAAFNEAMDPATITASSFTLATQGGAAVAGAVTYTAPGSIATFAPAAALAASTVYVATLTTGASSLDQRPLAANYTWSFTTGAALNGTKPTIVSTNAADQATGVPTNQAVSATFSQSMTPATINATTFTLTGPNNQAVAGLVTYAVVAQTATFTPTASLLPNTAYTATVTTGAQDLAGNALGAGVAPNPWTFTTAAAPALGAPTIISTNPSAAGANVAMNATVNATFSKAMDPTTITTTTFQLTDSGGAPVSGTVAYNSASFIATFTPLADLTAGATYTATLSTGVTDLAGNPLAAGAALNPWNFTVANAVLPAISLGTASTFGGFGGGAGMTNQGLLTVINGNTGTTGASTVLTGFHDSGTGCTYTETPLNQGFVNGNIYTAAPPPTVGCPTEGTAVTMAVATQAAQDVLAAFNATSPGLMPPTVAAQAAQLSGLTLPPGIYQSASGSFSITGTSAGTGDLTLDAQGNANAVWVFQAATSLTVGIAGPTGARNVILINGAQAKNVYWHVGSAATINAAGGGTMVGTILAQAGISLSTAGNVALTTLNGRALVLTGPVTMVNTVVNVPLP